jgi:transposase
MTVARDQLSKADMMMIATIEKGVPMLTEARDLIDSFQAMLRKKATDDLEAWIAQAGKSLVASFANGIVRDCAAVRVAIVEPWSNG